MIVPNRKDILHKNIMLRLLREILSDNLLANTLMFKGGTYAALLGVLDRFSLDLDFDLPDKETVKSIRNTCYRIFKTVDLEIKDESRNHLQFFLKYKAPPGQRNTLKLEINDVPSPFNIYEEKNLLEINMYCKGHSMETMFANKLVAAKARHDRTGHIAGRDFYDLHRFFEQGFGINKEVVEDLTHMSCSKYLESLLKFMQKNLTRTSLLNDLNPLLPPALLKKFASHSIGELSSLLTDEIRRQQELSL